MKRLFALLLLVSLAAGANAQLYIRAQGAYQLEAGTTAMVAPVGQAFLLSTEFDDITDATSLIEYQYTDNADGSINASIASGSYAKGIQIGIAVGYQFSEVVAGELGIGYLLGSDVEFNSLIDNQGGGVLDFMTAHNTTAFTLTPAIVVTMPSDGAIQPYVRFGAMIALSPTVEQTGSGTDAGTSFSFTNELNGSTAIGFNGGVGINYAINEMIGIDFGISYTGASFKAEDGTLTNVTVDGVDQTQTFIGSIGNNGNYAFVETYNENSTDFEVLERNLSFSSLNFSLGFTYTFGN